jgi:hypothetical protein
MRARASSQAIAAAQQKLAPDRIGFGVQIHLTTGLVVEAVQAAYDVDVSALLDALQAVVAVADRRTPEFDHARALIIKHGGLT